MKAALLLSLLALASSSASSSGPAKRTISTWVAPGKGGPMGDDLTQALAWVTVSQPASAGSQSAGGPAQPASGPAASQRQSVKCTVRRSA